MRKIVFSETRRMYQAKRIIIALSLLFLVSSSLIAGPVAAAGESYVFVLKWGVFGNGDGQLAAPRGMDVDSNGNIYVVDSNNCRVTKFTSTGVYLMRFGLPGAASGAPGYLSQPCGIAIDSNDNVYVADTMNNRIQKFTSNGGWLGSWGGITQDVNVNGKFWSPSDVAVDSQDNIYVADSMLRRVQKFTSDGTFITKWGTQGNGDGQFGSVSSVYVGPDDYVYAADPDNFRVQKFTSNGAFLTKWGSNGSGDGQFKNIPILTVDALGNVYVSDNVNHRIQKFTSNGGFITKWGSYGLLDGLFKGPWGVIVDASGYVYVSDYGTERIQKFALSNQPPVAVDDSYSVNEDQTLTVAAHGVLGNDNDPDGNPLTAELVTGTSSGSLTLNTDGSFTYTPGSNFHGSDSFTYKAKDASLYSNIVTVTITINPVNDGPIANAGGPYSGFEGSSITLDASVSNDPDGDPLQYRWDFDSDGVWDTGLSSSPTISHTWNDNWAGSVRVEVSDGALTGEATAAVTVSNVNPVVEAGADETIAEGDIFSRSGSFTDPGADTWSATVDYGEGASAEALVLSGKTFSLSNLYEQDGSYTVTVKVSDDDGYGQDIFTVTVNNVAPTATFSNNGPKDEGCAVTASFTGQADPGTSDTFTYSFDWDNDGNYEIKDQAGASAQHTWTDNGVYTVGGRIKDDDGGYTKYTTDVTISDLGPTAAFDWSPKPQNEGSAVSFTDQSTSSPDTITSWAWDFGDGVGTSTLQSPTYTYMDDSLYTVRLTVTDDDGSTNYVEYGVTVSNVNPVVEAGPDQVVGEGDTVSFVGSFTDAGSVDTHIMAWGFGDGGTASGSLTPTHVYTDNGVYTVTLTVTDDDGGAASDTLSVTVNEVSTTPTVSVKTSSGNPINSVSVFYYSGGWKEFGVTDEDGLASKDVLPGTYTFRVSYGGASLDKTQNVASDTLVKFQTAAVSFTLLSSAGDPLSGGAQYYAGGWKTFGSGSTGSSMELLPISYTFRVSYAGASLDKTQNVASNPTVTFQTKTVQFKLLDSSGTQELSANAQYYAGSWKTFGSGTASTTMELLPVNYTFRVGYGGASLDKTQNVATDQTVTFQTKAVTMSLIGSTGDSLSGGALYYAGGWKTFGSGSTSSVMELLPVSYTFRVSYAGASLDKTQNVASDTLVKFQTAAVTFKLLSSASTELVGVAQYYAGGWRTFGSGTTSTTMELLPVSYTFRVSIGGASLDKTQNVASSALIVFQTVPVTFKLLSSTGSELSGGTQYYAVGWKTFGSGTASTTMELLPVSYTFRVGYGGASLDKTQNIASSLEVVFNTAVVHSSTGTCAKYYAGGWRDFTNNMEMLPVAYTFRFSDGTSDATAAVVGGVVNTIH